MTNAHRMISHPVKGRERQQTIEHTSSRGRDWGSPQASVSGTIQNTPCGGNVRERAAMGSLSRRSCDQKNKDWESLPCEPEIEKAVPGCFRRRPFESDERSNFDDKAEEKLCAEVRHFPQAGSSYAGKRGAQGCAPGSTPP